VFGPECIGEILGPEAAGPKPVPPRPRDLVLDLAGIGFLVAVAGSIAPWTRFGVASGLFGAWGVWHPRWSSLAAVAGSAGLVLWTVLRRSRRSPGKRTFGAMFFLALATIGGSLLHLVYPPPFTHPWLGPWVAIGGATVASAASCWLLSRSRRRRLDTEIP
jgi:amino acid transporter